MSHSAFSALVPGGAALQKCGGAACFEPTDAEVLHLPDKTAFQLGLKKESWSFSVMVVARRLRNAVTSSVFGLVIVLIGMFGIRSSSATLRSAVAAGRLLRAATRSRGRGAARVAPPAGARARGR